MIGSLLGVDRKVQSPTFPRSLLPVMGGCHGLQINAKLILGSFIDALSSKCLPTFSLISELELWSVAAFSIY